MLKIIYKCNDGDAASEHGKLFGFHFHFHLRSRASEGTETHVQEELQASTYMHCGEGC